MSEFSEDAALSAALQRLPRWHPPEDFAQRLSAAATRQAEARRARPLGKAGRVMAALHDWGPMTLGACAMASALALLPWDRLIQRPMEMAALSTAVMASAGVWLTLRTLRS
jgi:hypothetical protein